MGTVSVAAASESGEVTHSQSVAGLASPHVAWNEESGTGIVRSDFHAYWVDAQGQVTTERISDPPSRTGTYGAAVTSVSGGFLFAQTTSTSPPLLSLGRAPLDGGELAWRGLDASGFTAPLLWPSTAGDPVTLLLDATVLTIDPATLEITSTIVLDGMGSNEYPTSLVVRDSSVVVASWSTGNLGTTLDVSRWSDTGEWRSSNEDIVPQLRTGIVAALGDTLVVIGARPDGAVIAQALDPEGLAAVGEPRTLVRAPAMAVVRHSFRVVTTRTGFATVWAEAPLDPDGMVRAPLAARVQISECCF